MKIIAERFNRIDTSWDRKVCLEASPTSSNRDVLEEAIDMLLIDEPHGGNPGGSYAFRPHIVSRSSCGSYVVVTQSGGLDV